MWRGIVPDCPLSRKVQIRRRLRDGAPGEDESRISHLVLPQITLRYF